MLRVNGNVWENIYIIIIRAYIVSGFRFWLYEAVVSHCSLLNKSVSVYYVSECCAVELRSIGIPIANC